ncbi:MAG: hypothetical protein N2V76_10245 [Methanophagales archaeon]|nr:hypothetical protein [Methanophagales archaeon]
MTFLLGISLIAYDINNEEISRMGKFGNLHGSDIHRTPSSILQHLILYDYLHLFDQYFVLLPSVAIIKAVRIPIHVVARETVKFHCVEDMSFVIGGPCSGFELILLVPPNRDYDGVHEYRICRAEIIIIAIAVAYIANLMRVVTRYIVGLLLWRRLDVHGTRAFRVGDICNSCGGTTAFTGEYEAEA